MSSGQTNYPIPDSHIILKYDDFDYSKKDVPIPPGLLLSGCDEVLIEIGKLMNAHNLDWKFLEGSEKGSDVEKGVFRSSQDLHIRIFPNRDGETITLTEAYDCVEGIKAAATDPKYGYTDEAWINLVNDGVGFGAITMYCDKDLWSKCFNKVVA